MRSIKRLPRKHDEARTDARQGKSSRETRIFERVSKGGGQPEGTSRRPWGAATQYGSAAECLAGLGTADQASSRLPEFAALGFKLADLLQYLIQPQAVGIGHRPTTLGREAVTEAVNTVDILGALGKAFIENACTLVDQRQNAALHDFLITHVTLGVAGFLGHFASHHVGFGVMDRLTAARLVAVEAMAALL